MSFRGASNGTPKVLIVVERGEWEGACRLPHMLHRAGAFVAAFAPSACRVFRSRYIDRAIHPRADFLPSLREHLEAEGGGYALVLLCDEGLVQRLASEEGHDWLDPWFPVDRKRAGELISGKAPFVRACQRWGVAIPESRICFTQSELASAGRAIGLPMVVKASHGCAGDAVRRADSLEDLSRIFRELESMAPLVAQEFVDGRVGSSIVLYDRGVPVCSVSSYKHRCFPAPYGPSCAREMLDGPYLDPMLDRVGRMTGFHGFCAVDWVQRRSDGAFLAIEFNPRPTPPLDAGFCVGVDFARSLRAMLRGGRLIQKQRKPSEFRRLVRMFPQDIDRCMSERDFLGLCAWLPGVTSHEFPLYEPRLMLSYVGRFIRRLLGSPFVSGKGRRTRTAARKALPDAA